MMSYLNAERAGRGVHLSSLVPDSVDRSYHEIWGWVKRNAPTVTSWGRGGASVVVEKTICNHLGNQ
jgi:hypothetical protein